jgi:TolA-binding protein
MVHIKIFEIKQEFQVKSEDFDEQIKQLNAKIEELEAQIKQQEE